MYLVLGYALARRPERSLALAYLGSAYLVAGLLLATGYLGRRRSVRTYQIRRDLVELADLLGVPVPEHPHILAEAWEIARSRNERVIEKVLVLATFAVVAAAVLALAVDPAGAPGRGDLGGRALWILLFFLPGPVAMGLQVLRLRRERMFRSAVQGQTAALATRDAHDLRQRLQAEVELLEAQILNLRELDAQLEADQPVDAKLLGQMQKMTAEVGGLRIESAASERRAVLRDVIMAGLGVVAGAVLQQLA